MGQKYVISGCKSGIGLELTKQLLDAGNEVYGLGRQLESAKELQALKNKYQGRLHLHLVDVTSTQDVQAFAKTLGSREAIDVLINNAGVYMHEDSDFEKLDLEDVRKTFDVNTVGAMRLTQALLPNLQKSSNPKIVAITSLMGSIADNTSGRAYGYRISKAALNMFVKNLSNDYPKLTSLAIHPGWVKTRMGGSDAPTSPEESARGILRIIMESNRKDSGKFFDFEGDELPW